MGMFDEIHYNGKLYQTKDFDCEMRDYWIENGRLIKSIGRYESVPMEERPYPGDGFMSICGSIRWIEEERRDINYHGWLYFYGDEEYKAKFTDGNLVELIQLDTQQDMESTL